MVKKSMRVSRLADLMSQQTINQFDQNQHKEQELGGKKTPPHFQILTCYSSQDVVWVREPVTSLQKSPTDVM